MIFPCFRLALLLGIVSSVLSRADFLFTLQEDNVYVQSTDRKGAWRFRIGTVANSSCPIATKLKVVPTEGSEGLEKLPGWDDEKDTNTTTEVGRNIPWFLNQVEVIEGKCLGDEQTGHGRRLTQCFRTLFMKCIFCCRRRGQGGETPLIAETDASCAHISLAVGDEEDEEDGEQRNLLTASVQVAAAAVGYPAVLSFSGLREAYRRQLRPSLQTYVNNGAQIVVDFGVVLRAGNRADIVPLFLSNWVDSFVGAHFDGSNLRFMDEFPFETVVLHDVGDHIAGIGWDMFPFTLGGVQGQVYVYPGPSYSGRSLGTLAFELFNFLVPCIESNALQVLLPHGEVDTVAPQMQEMDVYLRLINLQNPSRLPQNQVRPRPLRSQAQPVEQASSSSDTPVYTYGQSDDFTLPHQGAQQVHLQSTQMQNMVFLRFTFHYCATLRVTSGIVGPALHAAFPDLGDEGKTLVKSICASLHSGVNNVYILAASSPLSETIFNIFQANTAAGVAIRQLMTIDEVNPSEVPIYMGFFSISALPQLPEAVANQEHSLLSGLPASDPYSIGQTFPFFCTGNQMTAAQASIYMKVYLLAFQLLFSNLGQLWSGLGDTTNPLFLNKWRDDHEPDGDNGPGFFSPSQSFTSTVFYSASSGSGGNQPTCSSFRGGTETKQRAGTLTRFVATPTTDAFAVSEAGFFEEISAAELATLMYQGHSRQVSEVLGWRVRMHGPKVQLLQQLGDDEIAAFGEKPKRREKRVYKTKDEAASALQGMYRRKLARDRFKVLLLCNLEKYYDEESDRKSCSQPNDDREPFWLAPFRHLSLATILG
mmetsp:Transcript_3873/g.8551  ORF Transcript_3873/g.8551 Transcript_3873/m.8551 type:complete len:816 (-) Transcript_3873:4284-6731(-)